MVKIKYGVDDSSQQTKQYGVMPALVDSCEASIEKSQGGNEYSLLTLSLSLENGSTESIVKKMFFRLPYDSWAQKPGQPESLFNQFRKVTGLSSEELSDTKNYLKKGFYVVVGPSKTYSKEWRTFNANDGRTLLSYNIIEILEKEPSKEEQDAIESNILNMIESAKKEISGETTPSNDSDFKSPAEILEF